MDVMQSFVENMRAGFGDVASELKSLKLLAQACQSSVGSGTGADGSQIRNGVLFPSQSPNGRDAGNINAGEPLGNEILKIVIELRNWISKLEVSCSPSNGSGGDGPPHFGGLGLTCIEDLASWNVEHEFWTLLQSILRCQFFAHVQAVRIRGCIQQPCGHIEKGM